MILQRNLAQTPDPATAFGNTFWWPLLLAATAVLPTLLLPSAKSPKAT